MISERKKSKKNQLIYEFQKNALEKVKIRFLEFRGTKAIDIRAFYRAIGTTNEWKPSKKGICMSEDLLGELIKGLELARKKRQEGNKISKA